MSKTLDDWKNLKPELSDVIRGMAYSGRRVASFQTLLCFLGGYIKPTWATDNRPQPLKSRTVVQHFRTQLRRQAVTRMRLDEKSFREIGRELGISQVAAWKLWQQVMEDQVKRRRAEVIGARIWQEIHQKADDGDFIARAIAFDRVARHFGIQIARRFLGRIR